MGRGPHDGEADDAVDREAILRRRARLVALAVAGLTSLGSDCDCGPQVCLDIAVDAGPDGGADAGLDGGPDGGDDAGRRSP